MSTAIEWLKRIADKEIREKALANATNGEYAHEPNCVVDSVATAIEQSFTWRKTPEGHDYWLNMVINPPELLDKSLPTPDIERERDEKVLREFADWFNDECNDEWKDIGYTDITTFLETKYKQ